MESVVGRDGAVTHYRCSDCSWTAPVLSVGSVDTLAKSRELAERAFARHVCADYKLPQGERRRDARYSAAGRAELRAGKVTVEAEPVNLGKGGMIVRAKKPLPVGTEVVVLFTLAGHPGAIAVRASIVHSSGGVTGLGFLDRPPELERLLRELDTK